MDQPIQVNRTQNQLRAVSVLRKTKYLVNTEISESKPIFGYLSPLSRCIIVHAFLNDTCEYKTLKERQDEDV
jgi:hypothetical protein